MSYPIALRGILPRSTILLLSATSYPIALRGILPRSTIPLLSATSYLYNI